MATSHSSLRPEAGGPRALPAFLQNSAADVPPPARTARGTGRGFAVDLLVAAGLAAAAFLLYLPALSSNFIEVDDPLYVTSNPVVKQGLTLHGIQWAFTTGSVANWLPMVWLSHMAAVSLFGLEPGWHHAVNTVLHACNAALVFLVLRSMTGRRWCAALAAALWAFHPLRVESVAWVAERKDVLSGFFFLLTLLAYSHYVHRPGWRRYGLVLVLFAVALMSKTVVVTVPFLLLVLDVWPLQRGRWTMRVLAEKVPLLVLSVIASAWTVVLQRQAHEIKGFWSLGQRLGNADVSIARYLLKTFWPTGLSAFYPHPGSWPAGAVIASSALIVGVTLAAWFLRRRMPYVLVGWLWFLGTLVPVCGLVQVGFQSMADRYTYLPSIGLAIAVVWAGAELAGGRPAGVKPEAGSLADTPVAGRERAPASDSTRAAVLSYETPPAPSGETPAGLAKGAMAPLAVVMLAVLAVATLRREAVWHSTLDLFEDALAVDEQNWKAHDIVGAEMVKKGDDAAALQHFQRSAELNTRNPFSFINIGTVLRRHGETKQAVEMFRKGVERAPEVALCHQWLGLGLAIEGDYAGADREFAEASRLDPNDPTIPAFWASSMAARGRLDRAKELANKALEIDPTDPKAVAAMQRIDQLMMQRRGPTTESAKP